MKNFNIKVQAVTDTTGIPQQVYCNFFAYLNAYKVHTNCLAYRDGEQYWINPRFSKVVGKA